MYLLVTGAWQNAKAYIPSLEAMGHKVVFLQHEKDELPCPYNEVEGVICNGLFLHHDIEVFTSLRYIQLTSAGFDRLPMGVVKDKKITVHNARGVYSIPMAEFALASVLSVYKQIPSFFVSQKDGRWNKQRNLRELNGKRVCIVGCGNVGTECAKRFLAMGCEIVGVDVCPHEDMYYKVMLPVSDLDTALLTADIVLLTLPLLPETRYLFGYKQFALLPDGCVIVNIARGAVMDTNALVEVLKTRDLTAILDVFEEEPLSVDSPLWNIPNVLLTPHNSFVGEGNENRLFNLIRENLSYESK